MSPYRDAPDLAPRAPSLSIRWIPRGAPLSVRGVTARGAAALDLAGRLLALEESARCALRGVAAEGDLVVLGDHVPWVDGATWLGRDESVPGWMVPTALRTDLPTPLLVRALIARGAHPSAPYAMWPVGEVLRVVPLAEARPLSAARITAWRETALLAR